MYLLLLKEEVQIIIFNISKNLNNLSFFSVKPVKSSSGPSKPPEVNESEQAHMWSYGKAAFEIQLFLFHSKIDNKYQKA